MVYPNLRLNLDQNNGRERRYWIGEPLGTLIPEIWQFEKTVSTKVLECSEQIFQPTTQPTVGAVLHNFRVPRQSPRVCKSLKNLAILPCHSRGLHSTWT